MVNSITPQVDVGTVSLSGLSAFTSVLTALSADNVVPMAMLQMEKLGAGFLISGEYAAKVPDYLQRCSSVPLGNLALSIGWRKGDAASLMASSAGGQAAALLALCLFNLYNSVDAGNILLDLSRKLLPRDLAISSVAQLVGVGTLLRNKLDLLGFGNLLARQVTRIYGAYETLGLTLPEDFLDPITAESMTELLEGISRVLRESSLVMRITGTRGLGQVLGLIIMMFPEDTAVTVNGLIVFEGPRKSILLEIDTNCDTKGMSHFQVENLLAKSIDSIICMDMELGTAKHSANNCYSFVWNNWVPDFLQLSLLNLGLTCPPRLLVACCDVVGQLPKLVSRNLKCFTKTATPLPNNSFMQFLGRFSQKHIENCCKTILGTVPSWLDLDIQGAVSHIEGAVLDLFEGLQCSYGGLKQCEVYDGWETTPKKRGDLSCKRYQVSKRVAETLEVAFWSLFVNAGSNTTVQWHHRPKIWTVPYIFKRSIKEPNPGYSTDCEEFYRRVMELFSSQYGQDRPLACSSGASVIFPAALRHQTLDPERCGIFELVEGRLVLNGTYHVNLLGQEGGQRPRAKKNIESRKGVISPNSFGEHSNLAITVRDCDGYLELRCTAAISGSMLKLDLHKILMASYGVQKTEPCDHASDVPLHEALLNKVRTTSIASPVASGSRIIAIVQTYRNPTAQLLGCETGCRTYLLRDCCLNCAVENIDLENQNRPVLIIV